MINQPLLDALDNNPEVLVTFKTKSSTIRKMSCTRHLLSVPSGQRAGITNPKLNGSLICCVYDLVNKDWRAFRWDSVIEWSAS
jgi:hypothetical protein